MPISGTPNIEDLLVEIERLKLENSSLFQELKESKQIVGAVLDQKTIENSFLSKMVQDCPFPMIRVNRSLDCTFLNTAAQKYFFEASENKELVKESFIHLAVEAFSRKTSFSNEIRFQDKTYLVDVIWVERGDNVNMYFVDNTTLKNADEMLWESEQKYRRIVEKSEDMIIKTDREGSIIFFNVSAEKKLGVNRIDAVGENIISFIKEDHRKRYLEFFTSNNAENNYLELPFINSEGKEIWFSQYLLNTTQDGNRKITISRDITESLKYQLKLETSENRYKKAIANMRLGLLEVDSEGEIIYVHEGFTEITGFTNEDLLGKKAIGTIEIFEEDLGKIETNLELRKRGLASTYEITMKSKNGEWLNLMVSGIPLMDDNKLIGTMGIHMDITTQKNNEKKLLEQSKKVEETAKAKELFLANMSHEIRTPLNAILGVCRLLANTEVNTKQSEFIQIIGTSASNLKTIIDDILDLSKINSGKLSLENSQMELQELLTYVKETNFLKSKENNNTILVFIDDLIEKYLLGDPTRLGQILNNLVSNAVKFTSFGQINISATLLEDFSDSQKIRIKVQDNGEGISNENIERIFNPFVQGDDSTTRKYGGTGLGLSITKELLKLYHSELQVKSRLGDGSEFWFDLELAKISNPLKGKVNVENSADLSHLKILLAEDNNFNQIVVKGVLEPTKVKLYIVDNGQRVLEFLQHTAVDLILMDIQMPIMNGMECSERIRNELKSNIPIISLSANVLQSDIEKYLKVGINDYVNKPFEPKDLINKIIKWSDYENLARKVEEKEAMVKLKVDGLYSLDKLVKMLSGNQEYIKESLKTLVEHTPEVISNLQEAYELDNLVQVSKLAHRLKATCNILSIDSLADILLHLDNDISDINREALELYVKQVVQTMNEVILDIQKME